MTLWETYYNSRLNNIKLGTIDGFWPKRVVATVVANYMTGKDLKNNISSPENVTVNDTREKLVIHMEVNSSRIDTYTISLEKKKGFLTDVPLDIRYCGTGWCE